jgi:phosphatidylserine synthase
MPFRPTDVLTLLSLGAAIVSLLAAFRGHLPAAAYAFLASFVADLLHQASAGSRGVVARHRFGAELAEVVTLVAFGAAPCAIVFSSLSRSGLVWVAAAAAAALLVGAVARMAWKAARDAEPIRQTRGLPRPFSALIIVSLSVSAPFGDAAHVPLVVGTSVFVALLNVSAVCFERVFLPPLSWGRVLVWGLAATGAGVGFVWSRGFEVLAAIAVLASAATVRRRDAGAPWRPA